MEDPSGHSGKDPIEETPNQELKKQLSAETGRRTIKTVKPTTTASSKVSGLSESTRKRMEARKSSGLTTTTTTEKSTTSRSSNSVPAIRRNSTGGLGLPENQSFPTAKKQAGVSSVAGKRSAQVASDPLRRSMPEVRRSSLSSTSTRTLSRSSIPDSPKSVSSVPITQVSRSSATSDANTQDSVKKSSVKLSPYLSSSKRVPSTSVDSTASSTTKKLTPKVSSPSYRSPSISSGSKGRSSSSSIDRNSGLSGRRRVGTPESRDSRFITLPQVDIKAGDDVRLDLRGHKIRSLNANGLNLSPNLEFVYLRDNLLSTLEGVEVLKRVKVLDLSFNDFKGPGFEPLENCKVLQQLYLAGNQITSLASLPEFPNLEFLSVAQNRLKSLSMASQPRLQVLAASKNRISTLKGFPHLPALEHLRLEENPILEMLHLEAASILLVGPTLKKFNDRDLSQEELAYAKRYPAHTALCIRGGWEFCRPEHSLDSTFRFLFEQWKDQFPPGYLLKEAYIDPPFEEDACCCHFTFGTDMNENNGSNLAFKYQWFVGERTPSNFTAIPNATEEVYWPKNDDVHRILKVECTPVLGGTEYPIIFAISSPVSPGTGCPKVLKIDVRGELVEGSTIRGHAEVAWCGGTPAKGVASWLRRRWNSSPVVILGAEDEEYQLTLDDVDSCLVFMYTPMTEEGAKGEPQYAITDYIKPALPSVSDVQIIGDVVEGCTIRGVGKYFGGREGPSRFEWRCEDKAGELVVVSTGTTEYTLTKEDVGRRLAFVYIPINFEGHEGNSVSIMSEIVKQAPPKVTSVKIIGDMKEGSKVTVTGCVTGGSEGSSRVQWFKTSSSKVEDENGFEALSTSKIAKAFRIPLGAVGYFIVAKFTPMTLDGESGEPAYAVSEKVVETLPPSLNFLSITGDYSEGGILTASYGYIGGHEGKSIYNWYLHEVETDHGSLIWKASGLLQYRVSKDAIGKFVSFMCTPARDDGMVGEPRTYMGQEPVRPGSPRLLSLVITGAAVEGSILTAEKKYWGGDEGDSVFRWFRTDSDGSQHEVKNATSASYLLSVEDIGFSVSVSCEPVRSDWARGPIVLSEKVGPILPGHPTCRSLEFQGSYVEGERLSFISSYSGGEKGDCFYEWFRVKSNGMKDRLDAGEIMELTIEDVGSCIELSYVPVRKDGLKGSAKSVVSDMVAPAEPTGLELVLPDCCENTMVVPQKRYFGGHEGDGDYIWYRTKNKLNGPELLCISSTSEDVAVCGHAFMYTPSLEDVGAYLALYWMPTRADGKYGKPLISICQSPVTPAFPIVSEVRVKELSLGTYFGEGKYFGGHEGTSLFSWYRETNEGTIILINEADARRYQVTDSDYNCRLLFGYTPVRSDSVVGELKLSEPTDIILPELLEIEMLALTGKAVEGDVLTSIEVIPKSEIQQYVWGKFKKDVKYQWCISSESGDHMSFEPLPSQRSCSYKVRFEDIGRCLCCECVVTDVFGRSSEPSYVQTAPVLPGIPRIDKLEIEGRGFHTNLYAVRGLYSGGKEGKSRIQWLRSMVGSPDLISIPGETGRMYEANVDDVGYRLVAIYTPVREDGVEGQPVSASTDPIAVEPDVLKEVKLKLDLGSVKFEIPSRYPEVGNSLTNLLDSLVGNRFYLFLNYRSKKHTDRLSLLSRHITLKLIEALCDKDRSPKQVPVMSNLERRSLEVNKKRIKVVKPGSKTSFPTTEIRGSYAPPFHVELFRNDQHRLRIVVDSEHEVDLLVQTRHLRDLIVLVIRGFAQRFNSTSLNSLLKIGGGT